MTTEASSRTGLTTKLGFWLVLAMASAAMAEVLSGSFPLPFVHPWGPLGVIPVYGLHAVLGIWAVHRYGRPTFTTLYFAGVLFGMYEFYLTKVLFSPPWGDTISLLGIDLGAFAVLVFFWHPFFAFILPVAAAELAATSTRSVAASLPTWLQRPSARIAVTLFATAAVLHGSLARGPVVAIASVVTTLGGLGLAVWVWRREPRRRATTLRDLMPTGRQVGWLWAALGVLYVSWLPLFNPERLPGLDVHLVVAGLYGAAVWLFLRASRISMRGEVPDWEGPPSWWPVRGRIVAAVYLLWVVLASLLIPSDVVAILLWIVAIPWGTAIAFVAVRRVARADPPERP